jgi:hypothetical protein
MTNAAIQHLVLRSITKICVAGALWLPLSDAVADDMADAREQGTIILEKIQIGQSKSVWDANISGWFKQRMTKDAFLANTVFTRAQLGGVGTGRVVIQQNKGDGAPQLGYQADLFSFIFATNFPSGKFYETVTLVREDGTFKLTGMNFLPNPN